jgi:hypothetical protein
LRIAKPFLLITTPPAMVVGIHEAFRLAGGLAFLMIALVLMMALAIGMLVATIRREQRAADAKVSIDNEVSREQA